MDIHRVARSAVARKNDGKAKGNNDGKSDGKAKGNNDGKRDARVRCACEMRPRRTRVGKWNG
eukprot:151984-Chlamydomonas_euryale.AAC.4